MTISALAKIWKRKIESGEFTLKQCKPQYKDQVLWLLEQDYLNGVLTAEQYFDILGLPVPEPEPETPEEPPTEPESPTELEGE